MPLSNPVLLESMAMYWLWINVQLEIRAELWVVKNWSPTKIPFKNLVKNSEPSETSKMKLFIKIINGIQQKTQS